MGLDLTEVLIAFFLAVDTRFSDDDEKAVLFETTTNEEGRAREERNNMPKRSNMFPLRVWRILWWYVAAKRVLYPPFEELSWHRHTRYLWPYRTARSNTHHDVAHDTNTRHVRCLILTNLCLCELGTPRRLLILHHYSFFKETHRPPIFFPYRTVCKAKLYIESNIPAGMSYSKNCLSDTTRSVKPDNSIRDFSPESQRNMSDRRMFHRASEELCSIRYNPFSNQTSLNETLTSYFQVRTNLRNRTIRSKLRYLSSMTTPSLWKGILTYLLITFILIIFDIKVKKFSFKKKLKSWFSSARIHSAQRGKPKLSEWHAGCEQFAKVGMPVVLFCCGGMLMLKQVYAHYQFVSSNEFFFGNVYVPTIAQFIDESWRRSIESREGNWTWEWV